MGSLTLGAKLTGGCDCDLSSAARAATPGSCGSEEREEELVEHERARQTGGVGIVLLADVDLGCG